MPAWIRSDSFNPIIKRAEKAEQQRDALLSALKEAMEWNWLDEDAPEYIREQFLQLIAKIKEQS